MDNDSFESAYKNLNPEQREAVDAIEGPVMVIAGPGTGKTQILTLRIANILLKTDTPADAILALTFTESAAANMRRRLVALIGSRGYYVAISTFHGFCNRIIQEYPDHFPGIIGGKNASAVETIAIMREIIEAEDFKRLKPFGEKFFYVGDILKSIRDLKSEGHSPDDFARLLKKENEAFEKIPDLYHEKGAHKGKMKGEYQKRRTDIEKNEELLLAYRKYQEALRERRIYDFDDMILEVAGALAAKEDFLLEIQEKYQYLLVDEHQDTNGAQNRILELLASFYPDPNLFVVGDEKQAIFRFQGASLENFLYFKNKYPRAKLITLEANYRSTQTILDSAQSVIEKNRTTIKAPLTARKKEGGTPIEICALETPEGELFFVAETILALRAQNPNCEIAVLYRENKDAFPMSAFLERRGIPFVVESDQNILDDPDIQKLILLLETTADFGNDELLAHALHIDFFGIDPFDIYKAIRVAKYPEKLYGIVRSEVGLGAAGVENIPPISVFYGKLKSWRMRSKNEPFLNFLERIIQESGLLSHILSDEGSFQKMEKLSVFFEEARKIVGGSGDYRLEHFIRHLAILKEHGVPIKGKERRGVDAVRLMTAHRAKGLEFDAVFIVGAYDGHWGNKRAPKGFRLPIAMSMDTGESEKNEDERRLFYMALTRARTRALVSFAAHSMEGREQVPSQFIEEMRPELRISLEGGRYEALYAKEREIMFAPRGAGLPLEKDAGFLRELFLARGFAATHLNNYLECPWKYFYQNLVRLPSVPTKAQIYGIAVHGALQDFFERKKAGLDADGAFLLEKFLERLSRHPLSVRDRREIEAKAKTHLPAYWRNYNGSWNYNVITEFAVKGVSFEGITLTGKLDKVELLDEPGKAIVVDYKTKKPESRNWIEGKTENSGGDYKRQLVFYKLLLDLYPEKKFDMAAGVIDFVEPNERGVFKKEPFDIAEEEVEELKKTISRVADEILNLSFWNERCEERDCKWCKLRNS